MYDEVLDSETLQEHELWEMFWEERQVINDTHD